MGRVGNMVFGKLIPCDPIVWDEARIRGALTIVPEWNAISSIIIALWRDDNYILNRAEALKGIPMHIVHGRYDVDCLAECGAFELAKAVEGAELILPKLQDIPRWNLQQLKH